MCKHISITLIFLLSLQALATQPPTVPELLDKYAESQDKIKSFILEYEDEYVAEIKLSFLSNVRQGTIRGGYLGEVRSDGNKHYTLEKLWEENNPRFAPNKEKAGSQISYLSHMWDGENMYQYMFSEGGARKDTLFLFPKNHKRTAKGGKDIIKLARDHALRGVFEDTYARAPYARIDTELTKAKTMSVQTEMEEVDSSKCYILTAQTGDSKYKIWIDPEHGYNISKAEIFRNFIDVRKPQEVSLFTYLRNVRFERIGDVWVPMEADYGFDRKCSKGDFEREDHHCKRTKFILNPDHEALDSFKPSYIRNGTRTTIIGIKGIEYTWQDGCVVDEKGRVIMDCKPKKRPEKINRGGR